MFNVLKKERPNNEFFNKSLTTLFIRMGGVLFQFLILVFITKFFSEELVGQYNYINTVLMLLSSICLMGMGESFLLFTGKMEAEKNQNEIKSLYIKKLIILVNAFFVFLTIYYLLSRVFTISFLTTSKIFLLDYVFFAVFFTALSLFNFQVIRGLRKLIISEVFRNTIRYGFLLGIILIVLFFELKPIYILNSFLIVFATLSLSSTVFIFILFKRNTNYGKTEISTKKILLTSIPMSVSFLSLLTMQSFDTLMIEHFINIKSVAFYTVAVKVTFIVGIMQLTINSVIAPDISKYWFQNNFKELKILVRKAIKLNFIFTLPLIVGIIFLSETMLLFFGSSYINSKTPLLILLIGQALNSLCGPVGLYLNMTERQNILLKILIIATLINIILNLFLIPIYGIMGAAISTSISMAFWNLTGVFYIYKKDKLLLFVNHKVFK